MPGWCGVSENLSNRATQNLCQWPRGHVIRWSVVAGLPGWEAGSLVQCYESAFAAWAAACGARFQYVANSNSSNISIGSRRMDGQFGVLAEAELPCGSIGVNTQLRVWFDTGDSWVISANPPQGKVDLLRVAIHEFGHSLGLGHNQDGITNAIMDPSVSHIRTLQNWDIAQAIIRYGDRTAPTDPDEPEKPEVPGTGNDLADLLDSLAKCLRRSPKTTEALQRWLS